MRCQICNEETDNFNFNETSKEWEIICDRCKYIIKKSNSRYFNPGRDEVQDVIRVNEINTSKEKD